jgi:hypothetical protein
MLYANAKYYKDTFLGTAIPDEQLEKALSNAQDDIDSLTFNRIVARGFDNLTDFQQTKVKKAVCQQAEFMFTHGPYLNLPVSNFKAGSVSMSLETKEVNGIKTDDSVLNLLDQTGLRCLRL